jgi:hypothetical protein
MRRHVGHGTGSYDWPCSLPPGWASPAWRRSRLFHGRLAAQTYPPGQLGTLRRIARRNQWIVGAQIVTVSIVRRAQLMAHGKMPFEHLLLLTAHQADEVIFAHRAAHRNSRLRPCGYGLRWVADRSQAACHGSDDDFELRGRDLVAGDVCRNNFCSQLQKVVSVPRLAHCLFQSNECDGARDDRLIYSPILTHPAS